MPPFRLSLATHPPARGGPERYSRGLHTDGPNDGVHINVNQAETMPDDLKARPILSWSTTIGASLVTSPPLAHM